MTNLTDYTVGWIGVGRMGYPMAKRLLDAGCDVSIYNRTRSKAEPLAEAGGKIVDSPQDLADRDIIFTMVSTSDDLMAVTFGENGVFTAEAKPKLLIDCSSISEVASADIRKRAAGMGIDMLASPVSGNGKVVKAGIHPSTVAGLSTRETVDGCTPARLATSLILARVLSMLRIIGVPE